jgi:hypothetical protein
MALAGSSISGHHVVVPSFVLAWEPFLETGHEPFTAILVSVRIMASATSAARTRSLEQEVAQHEQADRLPIGDLWKSKERG